MRIRLRRLVQAGRRPEAGPCRQPRRGSSSLSLSSSPTATPPTSTTRPPRSRPSSTWPTTRRTAATTRTLRSPDGPARGPSATSTANDSMELTIAVRAAFGNVFCSTDQRSSSASVPTPDSTRKTSATRAPSCVGGLARPLDPVSGVQCPNACSRKRPRRSPSTPSDGTRGTSTAEWNTNAIR